MSDDGAYGLTVIGFIGSVFSPYYAWSRRHGESNPLNHCALNVALYGPRARRWAMTERNSTQVSRGRTELSIGPSHMRWVGDVLEIRIEETCAPLPQRVRGTVRLLPQSTGDRSFALDAAGRHYWTPFAPCSRIEASFSSPDLNWSGLGYADCNRGDEPLEDAFSRWTWSRSGAHAGSESAGARPADATGSSGSTVLYDVTTRDRSNRTLALKFTPNGSVQTFDPPPTIALPTTGWRVARSTRADEGTEARVIATLEDAPFYSRSMLDTQVGGARARVFHESLDLDRFRRYWVQCLLPFRMPRVIRRHNGIR
jgi:carotenoid 1,2-hydratase